MEIFVNNLVKIINIVIYLRKVRKVRYINVLKNVVKDISNKVTNVLKVVEIYIFQKMDKVVLKVV